MASGTGALGRFVSALRGCGVQPSDRVAVALSGGPDSLALAAMTVWWHGFTRSGETPLALIVDHQLRPESGEEAAAVARQAEELGMQTRVLRVDWPAGQLPSLGDKMAAAREARYDLLLRACGEARRGALLLAHHADDQAETFLLRLMHASGVLGLACMPPSTDKRTELGRVRVVRPLLDFRKAELEEYCQQRGLEYVVDPTNAELSFHRNRIRHVLQQMPRLPEGAHPDLAGGGAEQPPATGSLQQGQAAAQPGSSSSSSRSSSTSGVKDASSSSRFSSIISAKEDSSSSVPTIIDDILRLQRRCQVAAEQQRTLGGALLRRAVLHTSAEDLPCAPPKRPPKVRQKLTQEQRKRQWLEQQPWFLNWDRRLAEVADALYPLRFALLDASCFEGLEETVAVGALARILQAVSGRKYPPPLAQSIRLHTLLQPGRLDVTYTGGGCLVRRLPRCKGRYLLCVAESDWPAAEAALARLPPPTEAEAERKQRKQQQQQLEQQWEQWEEQQQLPDLQQSEQQQPQGSALEASGVVGSQAANSGEAVPATADAPV